MAGTALPEPFLPRFNSLVVVASANPDSTSTERKFVARECRSAYGARYTLPSQRIRNAIRSLAIEVLAY
jgi:hypothetical protein